MIKDIKLENLDGKMEGFMIDDERQESHMVAHYC